MESDSAPAQEEDEWNRSAQFKEDVKTDGRSKAAPHPNSVNGYLFLFYGPAAAHAASINRLNVPLHFFLGSHDPLTVSRHGAHVGPVHDTLVLLGQRLDVALAQVQDLLLQHAAVLVAGSLLDGEVQQHHAPDEPKADQEEAQLLGRQLPQEGRGHADGPGVPRWNLI